MRPENTADEGAVVDGPDVTLTHGQDARLMMAVIRWRDDWRADDDDLRDAVQSIVAEHVAAAVARELRDEWSRLPQAEDWFRHVGQCEAKSICPDSGQPIKVCQQAICDCFRYPDGKAHDLTKTLDRANVAEAEVTRLRGQVAAVRALRDDWADFEHDAITCPKYDCGDCTMINAIHDLDQVLDAPAAAQPDAEAGERDE